MAEFAELVGNCPRCNAQDITFDLTQDTLIHKSSVMEGVAPERRFHGAIARCPQQVDNAAAAAP